MSVSAAKLEQELSLFKSQLSSFQNRGTQSSATRARAHLLNLKKEADNLRKQLLVEAKEKKAAKTSRVAPEPVVAATPPPSPEPVVDEPEPLEVERTSVLKPVKKPKKKRAAKKV